MPKIVTLGGGTGAPIIIQALLQAGFKNISCICASMDSGGKTGIIRSDERDQVIAISDLLRNLIALITSTKHQKNITALKELLSYVDGRQRNIGYIIYYALLEKYQNNFLEVQKHLENLLGIEFSGTAIPVTTDPTNINFITENGTEFKGEHELDKQSMSKNMIADVWLDPIATATPEAIKAIRSADYLIYCPGSLYGSILSNCLPEGITKALRHTKAKKILISNIVSNRNQTHNFTPQKYFEVFRKYTNLKKPFDYFICPNISKARFEKKFPKITKSYSEEHAHFLGWSKTKFTKLKAKHIKIVSNDIIYITPHLNRLRHDPEKLSKILKKIIK